MLFLTTIRNNAGFPMKYIDFRSRMAPFTLFSLHDARILEPAFDRRRLHEWGRKGYIKPLTKGWYLFADAALDDDSLDRIANRIYAPSYVSLETVLSRKGLIPETVRRVTSITTRKTRDIRTEIGSFTYRTVAPRLFFGYEMDPNGAKVACAEKAILDFLYLHADLAAPEDFESLRIDKRELAEKADAGRFNDFLSRFGGKALTLRARRFMEWARNA
jgi:predicted transcriptional regulator of viral defense system